MEVSVPADARPAVPSPKLLSSCPAIQVPNPRASIPTSLVIEDSPAQTWATGTLTIQAALAAKPALRLAGLLVLEENGKKTGYEINVPIQNNQRGGFQ